MYGKVEVVVERARVTVPCPPELKATEGELSMAAGQLLPPQLTVVVRETVPVKPRLLSDIVELEPPPGLKY